MKAHTWTRKGALVSIITAFTVSMVLILSPILRSPSQFETASRIVFSTTLPDFIAMADNPGHDTRFTWDSDKCSAPILGSAGKTYDFSDSCRRHDFAYRNLGRMDGGKHWTAALRTRVDNRFMTDMRSQCAARPSVQRTACRAWARLYFNAVRQFAGP